MGSYLGTENATAMTLVLFLVTRFFFSSKSMSHYLLTYLLTHSMAQDII
jgi:hypothetical protein